jgi:predicted nuclease of restriction endonuclease-like (RecB) superfamily
MSRSEQAVLKFLGGISANACERIACGILEAGEGGGGNAERIGSMKNAIDSTVMTSPEYRRFIEDLKTRVISARICAARAMNRDLILLYWDIGNGIVEKQNMLGWGDAVVEMVAADLRRAFPVSQSFSPDNLWRMRQFYLAYSTPEFLGQAVPEIRMMTHADVKPAILGQAAPETGLAMNFDRQTIILDLLAAVPWGQNLLILKKLTDPAARLYYICATAQFGWSRNVLLNQIKANAYERAVTEKKTHNFPLALPEYLAEQADEAMKSTYNLEFLGIYREVKAREPEYAGKMDFYLNLLNEKERGPDDNPSIGIILCAEKDDVEVEYALKSRQNPIGVAEYQLQSKLPAEMKGKLPTAGQFAYVVRTALSEKEEKRS